VPFGEECCELIDWQVRLVRVVIRRPTYRRGCRCPVRGVLAAPPALKPIGKGRFTTGFLARLLVEKFVLGRPTHRIAAALAHDGLDLAEGTLAGVLAACSDLLAPLTDKISERNAAAAHLHVDETRWQVFAAVEGKDSHRWWLWVFAGPDTTVFRIAPSRSLKVLTTQLGVEHDPDTGALPDALPAGRRLLLSSDFYTVYQSVGRMDGVDNLWCWSPTSAATSSALATPTPTCRRGPRPGWSGSAGSTAPTPHSPPRLPACCGPRPPSSSTPP
jgi:transposase